MQAWGLIVLLVSKAAGHAPDIPDMEEDKAAGVLHSQRALAEVNMTDWQKDFGIVLNFCCR